jgi:oligopeptide/dipeptide ABC transporter ATP-binding protein
VSTVIENPPQAGSLAHGSERPLLAMENLQTHFRTEDGVVRAVDGVSFHVGRGETVAVVGESGSGKSVTSLSIMRLIPPPGAIVGGSITFDGRDLLAMSGPQIRAVRGNEIGMIFQEPMTSLNPVKTIGDQIAEAVALHQKKDRRAAHEAAIEMLDLVGIPDPRRRVDNYPHQMSGGMRQRAMIAMALCCKPKLLIADEPTTALDVTIQAQILDLMRKLQREMGMSILFITHDLGVVAEMADRVVVMYAGRVVEEGDVRDIFARPRMPYTRALMNSIPRLDKVAGQRQRLESIPGTVPNLLRPPKGCAFHPRCGFVRDICLEAVPPLEDSGGGHTVRCVRWREIEPETQSA